MSQPAASDARPASGERPFRLLVDGHTFDVGPQGTTTFLAGLLNALPPVFRRETGRDLSIFCAAQSAEACRQFLDTAHTHVAMQGGFVRRNLVDLHAIGRARDVDLTLSQYVRPWRLHGKSAAVIHDVLFLDFPHLFSWPYRESRRLLFGWSARHSDLVATVSDYSRRRIAHWFGIPCERIHIVPNGVEPVAQSARPEEPGVRMLCVSRFEERKRQDWCIRAAADLAARGLPIELDIVGSGEGTYAEHVRSSAAAASHEGAVVRMHGRLDEAALGQVWQTTSLALFPSACEGFGLPVIEAAARGIPCVVADNTALTELRPYFAGPSFGEGGYAAFLEALAGAVANLPQLTAEARARAPSVSAQFSWRTAAERFVAALRSEGIA